MDEFNLIYMSEDEVVALSRNETPVESPSLEEHDSITMELNSLRNELLALDNNTSQNKDRMLQITDVLKHEIDELKNTIKTDQTKLKDLVKSEVREALSNQNVSPPITSTPTGNKTV